MKCEWCDETEKLTDDHIIPRWLYKRCTFLAPQFSKNLGRKNKQKLCAKHNNQKGGGIDTRHPIGRAYWTMVRDNINEKLNETTT